jgi:hypothetical protein
MSSPTKYLKVDEHGPYEVYCMQGCGTLIADRKIKKLPDGQEKQVLMHQSHSRTYPVLISDGSYANMLLCKQCLNKANFDMDKFEKTMYWGWETTQKEVYKNKKKDDYDKALKRVDDMKALKKIVGPKRS